MIDMKKRQLGIIKIVLCAGLLVLAYIIQSMIFTYVRIFGLVPLILPIVSTGVAVYGGRTAGGVSGLFAGMFTDLSLNQPLALFTVILTFAGVGVGTVADTIFAKRFGTYFISCAAVLAACAIVQLFPLLIFEGVPAFLLFNTALRQTVYSLVFAIPIWFAIRKIISISDDY